MDTENGWPKVSAFYPRENDDYLSSNWLEYHSPDRDVAVNSIRKVIPLKLTVGGRFVVLNVGEAIESIIEGGGRSPTISYAPEADNLSHASIWWEDILQNHQMVAAELHVLIVFQDIYPGKIP